MLKTWTGCDIMNDTGIAYKAYSENGDHRNYPEIYNNNPRQALAFVYVMINTEEYRAFFLPLVI
jgi:hypothetical protein